MVQALYKRGYQPHIGFQAKLGQKLDARQVKLNTAYSQARCSVEHGYGMMHIAMLEPVMRWIGKVRAKGWIGMRNFCYNIKRLCYLETGAEV